MCYIIDFFLGNNNDFCIKSASAAVNTGSLSSTAAVLGNQSEYINMIKTLHNFAILLSRGNFDMTKKFESAVTVCND